MISTTDTRTLVGLAVSKANAAAQTGDLATMAAAIRDLCDAVERLSQLVDDLR